MSQRKTSRLAWLDALRGLAALCVVVDHGNTLVLRSAQAFWSQWLDLGQYGVFVFFLVSGYIIPASLERKGSLRGFWVSRAFRLYPLYLLAIGLSVIGYKTGLGTLRGAEHHQVSAVASWLLMIPNLLTGPNVPNVTWTLSYEMTFYLLLAALFSVRAHRHSGSYALACAVVVVAAGGVLPMAALLGGHGLLGPGHVDLAVDAAIIAGIALSQSRAGGRLGRIVPAGGAWLAALTGLLLLTVNQNHYPYPWSGYTILAFMFTGTLIYRAEQGQVSKTVAAVVAVAVLAMTIGGGLWHGAQQPGLGTATAQWRYQWVTSLAGAAVTFGIGLALRHRRVPRALAWLGMISYSLYLIHPLVLDAFRDIRPLHDASRGLVVQVPLAAGLLAVIIAASAATYYLVERPMQGAGRALAKRWEQDRPQLPADATRAPEDRVAVDSGAGGALGSGASDTVSSGAAPSGSAEAPTAVAADRSASISRAVPGGSGGSP
jgi:peptidoglycan/LPS O-acetylase OafA/YrhL